MPELAVTPKRIRTELEKTKDREHKRDKYRRMTPEQKVLFLARQRDNARRWYTPERVTQKIMKETASRNANPERKAKFDAYHREWQKKHPLQRTVHFHNHRARLKNAEGSFTKLEWGQLVIRHDHRCIRCRRREPEIKLTVDHIVPLTLGGTNFISNIQPLCYSCNSRKGNREIG